MAPEYNLDVFELSDRASVSVKDIKLPHIIKNHTIFSPGTHNDMYYDKKVIENAFSTTSWDKRVRSVFLDHDDEKASKWLGFVENIKMREDGYILGDIELWDLETAIKLMGGAKFGVSPRVKGSADKNNIMKDFYFENFSVVMNPAVKTTYLNSEVKKDKEENKMADEVKPVEAKPETKPEVNIDQVMNAAVAKVLSKLESVEKELGELKSKPKEVMAEKPAEIPKEDKSAMFEKQLAEVKAQMDEMKRASDKPVRSTVAVSETPKDVSLHDVDKGMLNLLRDMEGLPPTE